MLNLLQWGSPFYLSHELPDGVTYLSEAEHLMANLMTINWLDTLRHPEPLFDFNLFKRPTEQQIANGLLIPVNVLNREETKFPQLFHTDFHELCQGTFILRKAEEIVCDMRRKQLVPAFEDLTLFHEAMDTPPKYIQGYI